LSRWQLLDPRASIGARVGWCTALPVSALWVWAQSGEGATRIAWGLAVIGSSALAAGALAARAWARVRAAITARDAADLSPLALQGPAEARALIAAVNAVLAHQHAATERQKRMVADAAHQLRTPLAALRAQLQSTPGESVAQRVPQMLRTVDRATDVANEFLAQMRLEQRLVARDSADWPELRLDDVAREAALEFSPLIANKRLAFELDALPVAVKADAWMLGELVRNLLANAIGHSEEGAPLGIVVRHALGAPELVVWDSGGGIADDVRERVFEPFAAATRGTGVGLGLSICRQLAQAMGASVELFNRSDGERVVGVDAAVRWRRPGTISGVMAEGDKE
jgi:two-component system sensor histidine kinase TctE